MKLVRIKDVLFLFKIIQFKYSSQLDLAHLFAYQILLRTYLFLFSSICLLPIIYINHMLIQHEDLYMISFTGNFYIQYATQFQNKHYQQQLVLNNQCQVHYQLIIIKMKGVKKEYIKQEYKQTKIESWEGPIIPATKVSPQVIQILRTTKVPELIIPKHTTIPGAAQIYFTEYLKLFSENKQLNADLIETFDERNQLAEKYNQLKREENDFQETIRRKRRFANQIRRDFPCPAPNCNKSYGSEGSLTQHVKLKHDSFYRSGQYQILLQNMLDEMAKQKTKKEQGQTQQKNATTVKVKQQKQEQKKLKKQE